MNPKALIPLVVGLGIAGVAAKMGMDYLKKANAGEVQTVTLWMVQEDVLRGHAITQEMLKELPYPQRLVPPGALADPEQIVGRIPHTGVNANTPILDSMLCAPGAIPGIVVPSGYRAVAVKIDESSGVDNHLVPGCRVDVVGMFEIRDRNRRETVARIILENIEVAAVGQRLSPTNPEEGSEDGKRERPARAATLLVKPDQVPVLHLAEQKGKLKLSMRSNLELAGAGGPSDGRIDEDALFGGVETPEEPTEETAKSNPLGDWLTGLMKQPATPVEPEPKPVEVVQAPAPPPGPPQPAWTMTVWNGDSRQVLAWTTLTSIEPVEMAGGGANIFEDPQQNPFQPPGAPSTKPTTNPPGKSASDKPKTIEIGATDPPSSETERSSEPEPKELFE